MYIRLFKVNLIILLSIFSFANVSMAEKYAKYDGGFITDRDMRNYLINFGVPSEYMSEQQLIKIYVDKAFKEGLQADLDKTESDIQVALKKAESLKAKKAEHKDGIHEEEALIDELKKESAYIARQQAEVKKLEKKYQHMVASLNTNLVEIFKQINYKVFAVDKEFKIFHKGQKITPYEFLKFLELEINAALDFKEKSEKFCKRLHVAAGVARTISAPGSDSLQSYRAAYKKEGVHCKVRSNCKGLSEKELVVCALSRKLKNDKHKKCLKEMAADAANLFFFYEKKKSEGLSQQELHALFDHLEKRADGTRRAR